MQVQGKWAWTGICVFTLAILLGCTAKYANLATANNVSIEILPSLDECVEIEGVRAFQDGDKLLVTGKAKKHGPIFTTYKGHIDVAVMSPDGEPVSLGGAEYEHHPSRNVISSFEVPIPVSARQGTRVYLLSHPVNGADSEHSAAVGRLLAQAAS
ncbi:MAG: hypothetical protein WAW37_13955 [Syntrophobacteraceae bacterium]